MNQGRVALNVVDVVHERLDDEVLAINMATGMYYSLRGSSADAWDALVAGASIESVAAALSARFPAFEVSHLSTFVEALLAADLVSVAAAEGEPQAAVVDVHATNYSALALEQHGDLQDLLLIDPIHEVGDAGWPTRAG